MTRILTFCIVVYALCIPASANPDGAPWGSANSNAEQNCSSCHFDGEPAMDSASISVNILCWDITSGLPITIFVKFENPENKKVGFQIMASAGAFTSRDSDMEANEKQVRSLSTRDNDIWEKNHSRNLSRGVVGWNVSWTPPEDLNEDDIYFWIAVNESNDDQSAFGDQIHYKTDVIYYPKDFRLLPALR